MPYIKTLKSKDLSEIYYPVTVAEAVYMEDGSTVADNIEPTTYPIETNTTYTLVENIVPDFGVVTELDITCPASGCYGFTFISGSTATTLTLSGVTMPDNFSVETQRRYEVNILNGYGVVISWEVPT